MAKLNVPRNEDGVFEPTEMRQANNKKTNFRVLVASLGIAVVVGIVLVAGFWQATPTGMDYSSGGKLQEQLPTPAKDATPTQTPTQAAPAPSQTPPSTTP